MEAKKKLAAVAAIGAVSLGALTSQITTSGASNVVARAVLSNQAGAPVGDVVFKKRGQEIIGIVDVVLPAGGTEFRGFHLHANNVDNSPPTTDGNPADGCVGDFTSVDGHWDDGTHTHGAHLGDLPVLMRDASGHAKATFLIGKFDPGQIIGRAVVVHAGADNYANIPGRYTSTTNALGNGADTTTLGNGDAGSRFACGVIVSSLDD